MLKKVDEANEGINKRWAWGRVKTKTTQEQIMH